MLLPHVVCREIGIKYLKYSAMVSSFRLSPCKIHIRNVGRAISQLPLLLCFCLCVVRCPSLFLRNQRLRFRIFLILFGSSFFLIGAMISRESDARSQQRQQRDPDQRNAQTPQPAGGFSLLHRPLPFGLRRLPLRFGWLLSKRQLAPGLLGFLAPATAALSDLDRPVLPARFQKG